MKAIIYLSVEAAERLAKDSANQVYSWDMAIVLRGDDVLYGEPDKPIPGVVVKEVELALPEVEVMRAAALAELDRNIQLKTAEMHKMLMDLQGRKQDLLAISHNGAVTTVEEGEQE